MFNIHDDNFNGNIMELIMDNNFIFINVIERNIIITKYSKLCFNASFLENLPLALVINKETYNFGKNKFADASQFRWSIDQNSLVQINKPRNKILVDTIPYINKMIFMIPNKEALFIFDKYNINKPTWLLEEEEHYEMNGGKRMCKNKKQKIKK
jgi:hypothetical protein